MSNGNGSPVAIEAKNGKRTGNSKPSGRKKQRTPRPTPRSPISSPPSANKQKELANHKPEPEKDSNGSKRIEISTSIRESLRKLGKTIRRFEDERSELKKDFDRMTEDEQEIALKEVYDIFSDNYDEHMEDTGHYGAITRLISKELAVHHFQFPIMDISAGTGVPICHFLCELNSQHLKEHRTDIDFIVSENIRNSSHVHPVYINDISEKMIEVAKERLEVLERDMRDEAKKLGLDRPPVLPDEKKNLVYPMYSFKSLYSGLKRKIGTIIVSQTFHIIPSGDKAKLAKAINWALAPGGRVILLEEFAWRARTNQTQTPIDVLNYIESIATPIQKKSDLISLFRDWDSEGEGKRYDMVSRATERIDYENRDHEMTITILQKPKHEESDKEKRQMSLFR